MLTLAAFEIPTGVRAWIEDVVVDAAARGQGVAGALVQAAVDRSAAIGARTVDLTSRPEREAANRLYLKLGFETARDQRLPKDTRHRGALSTARRPCGGRSAQPMATMGASSARPPVDPLKAASP